MRYLTFAFIVCFWIFPCSIIAQIPLNNNEPILTNDIIGFDKSKEYIQNLKISSYKSLKMSISGTLTLPVIVHIIHNNGSENISDEQVRNGIAHLNREFRYSGNGTDMQIEFCLAKQDPEGNFTTGINRIQSVLTSLTMESDDRALKRLISWDACRFINIWIVKSITSSSAGPDIAGYSTMPLSHGSLEDGIVIEASSFGFSAEQSRVVIHNFGHFLGLYHTFEGGCKNDNCLTDGDKVADTPPDATTQFTSCSSPINSCTTDDDDLSVNNPFRPVSAGGIGDQPDLSDNFMDYNYLNCLNSFTPGQKERARAAILNIRSSLLLSGACNSPCPFQIKSAFSIPSEEIQIGTSVAFTNTSTPESEVAYEWYLNGQLFSTVKNPVYRFSQAGNYTIKLVVKKDIQSCIDEYSKTIQVICPLKADFSPSGTFIHPGSTVHFENNSSGPYDKVVWLINDDSVSNRVNLNYLFRQEGFYTVSLIIKDSVCQSRKDIQVEVNNCPQISKRADYWYFGLGGGINFSSGIAEALCDNNISSRGAGNSISDVDGNFLFSVLPIEGGIPNYQVSVKDRNHNTMPNGAGLVGSASGSQIVIVPHPGNPNVYYIFSTYEKATGGLYYSIVDMSMNSGLGDVTLKNSKLQNFSSEKIASALHSNRKDYWIVTHPWNSDEFHAYLIDLNGLTTTPIVSKAGTVLNGQTSGARGVMKISPNGKLLAISSMYDPGSYVELFDFNATSGQVSNFLKINQTHQAYGLEFSPDASKLYISTGSNSQPGLGVLYQYDVALNNSKDIIGSKYVVSTTTYYGQMQIAPDGRIYFSKYYDRYMGVIQNPNKSGALCNYDQYGFLNCEQKRCGFGLPTIVPDFVVPNCIRISGPQEALPNAQGIQYTLSGEFPSGANVRWMSNGQVSICSQTSGTVTVNFQSAGTAKLIAEIQLSCGLVKDTLNINVRRPFVNLGHDFQLCNDASYLLDAGAGFLSYRWQDGSTGRTFRVSQPGIYNVRVTSAGGAVASDTIAIGSPRSSSSLDIGEDRMTCPGSIVVLDAGSGFSSYRWQDGSTNQTFTAHFSGNTPGTNLYNVTVTDLCGNTASDSVRITFDLPAANAGSDLTICREESAILSGTGTGSCKWYNASGNLIGSSWDISVRPSSTTFYVLKVEADGCSRSDTVSVTVTPVCEGCTVNAGQDQTICAGQSITLSASTNNHCTRNNCLNPIPPINCSSGCTIRLTGSMNANIDQGQVACIENGQVFTGSVNINGGTLIICGTARPSSLSFNSGHIVIIGDADLPYLTIGGKFENYGNTVVHNDCIVNNNGELINYKYMFVKGSLVSNHRSSNYSSLLITQCIFQNSNDIFTNECSITIGLDFHVNGTFMNKGTISVSGNALFNSGSQFVADDGSVLSVNSICISNFINGGSAGYASLLVNMNTIINSNAVITGLIDICDKNGIEIKNGRISNTVVTDCRCSRDGEGAISIIWSDTNGNIAGYGKQVTVKPDRSTVYKVEVIDANGNRSSDQITITVNNCN